MISIVQNKHEQWRPHTRITVSVIHVLIFKKYYQLYKELLGLLLCHPLKKHLWLIFHLLIVTQCNLAKKAAPTIITIDDKQIKTWKLVFFKTNKVFELRKAFFYPIIASSVIDVFDTCHISVKIKLIIHKTSLQILFKKVCSHIKLRYIKIQFSKTLKMLALYEVLLVNQFINNKNTSEVFFREYETLKILK
jgi:hypothetical protein